MSNNIVTLKDTKITLEFEAISLPDHTYEGKDADPKERVFPYHVKTTLKVGDQTIGLVTRANVTVDTGRMMPLIEVDFVNGTAGDPELVAALSPELRDGLVKYVGLLRQFPFVQVNVPLAPVI